jgi:transposase
MVADARAQWGGLDRRIAAFDAEFVRWTKENEDARRLTTIPGLGAVIASTLVGSVGRAEASIELAILRPGSASCLRSSPPAAN